MKKMEFKEIKLKSTNMDDIFMEHVFSPSTSFHRQSLFLFFKHTHGLGHESYELICCSLCGPGFEVKS